MSRAFKTAASLAGRLLVILGVVFLGCVLAPVDAGAAAGRSFGIKDFRLQTTRTVAVAGPLTRENWGFVNEPVPFTQAGGHPNGQAGGADALTAAIEFENEQVKWEFSGKEEFDPVPTRDPKDIVVDLPQGLLGNPTAVERCPLKQAVALREPCPASTQVGLAVIYLEHGEGLVGPIVNVVPEAGQSAEFAIETNHEVNFLLTGHVVQVENQLTKQREYGLTVVSNGIAMSEIPRVETSFWGVPAATIHDPERGLFCGREAPREIAWTCEMQNKKTGGEKSGEAQEVPFLTMPANCAVGPERAVIRADSWEEPGHLGVNGRYEGYAEKSYTMPGVTGCNVLQFDPGISINPDTFLADAPVGLGVSLTVPQFEQPQRLATPEMSRSVLRFPVGVSVSPGVVDGVQACNETGPEGINFEGPESEERGPNGELQLAPGHCPDASVVGTAVASTPLLAERIEGHVYLAKPGCGGPGQAQCTEKDVADGDLYQLYLELGGKGPLANTGVNIKVRLKTEADPATGQLTSVAEEIAQLPFSDLEVKLNGGPRAPLDNPPMCGQALTTSDFSTWAAPGTTPEGVFMPGLPDATPSSFFDVNGCADPPGLNPGFVAGTVTANAGKFSAFTMNIARADREQYVKGIQVHTPPGLLAMLSSVPLCGAAQADAGTCPESSKIGTTRVASGAGSHPFEIGGDVYLAGPYRGPCSSSGACPRSAPFGLSVVTHVVAGPFNLGDVVVRARIDVDQHDSSAIITTDESGPYALPQIVFGVPVRLKRVTVNIDRPGFMLNPTNCRAQQITAKISGAQDAVASVSSPFAVGACKSLAFKPVFKVSTTGHTSRKLGASLDTKLSYPRGALGNDANVAYVKVSLPKQLPSFIETLQKACIDRTFELDPADCPAGSVIGIARTRTPVLSGELRGPVYFVSHGGAKFPDIVIVLQGDGIRVDLIGNTFINEKTGITSTTFKTVPDVPVNSFELYLPQGPNHALAANGNLCKATHTVFVKQRITRRVRGHTVHRRMSVRKRMPGLVMPTDFVAQNGMMLKQETKITVTGCLRRKAKKTVRRGPTGRSTHLKGRGG